jgi:transposase
MDNLSSHKSERVRELIEERGCELLYLPPYSLNLNPIEVAFAKVKGLLREAEVRTREALVETIGTALSAVTARDAWGFFEHCGYPIRRIDCCSICSFCVPNGPLDPSNVN